MNLYVLIAVVAGSGVIVGGAYLKGRFDERGRAQSVQMKQFQEFVEQENKTREERIKADSAARLSAERFVDQVQRNLTDVKKNFAGLPMVTVGSSGCADINDNFRLRWNSAELAVGIPGSSSGVADSTLRDVDLPTTGELREPLPRGESKPDTRLP